MKKLFAVLSAVLMLFVSISSVFAAQILPTGLEEKVLKWRSYNSDTVGWLNIPGTNINNPVMWNSEGNQFYLRRNEKKQYDFNGCYFVDYRCDYSDYTLPKHTVIYGNSLSDDPNGKKFDQLKKYLDDDFAQKNPYIYFSDGNKTYTFKVFAVFYVDAMDADMPYNVPTIDDKTREKVIDKAKALSIREYKSQPTVNSKLLSISCPIYEIDGKPTGFPNTSLRYAVMAYAVKTPVSAESSIGAK